MDDVSTTGATLSSAAEALYASGAREVFAVTIARALPHHSLKACLVFFALLGVYQITLRRFYVTRIGYSSSQYGSDRPNQ